MTTEQIDGLLARFMALPNGELQHNNERAFLAALRRRVAYRRFIAERCGAPLDANAEAERDDIAAMNLRGIVATLEGAEARQREHERATWAAGASDRAWQRERDEAKRLQAEREVRRKWTEAEKAEARRDGFRID